MTQPLEVYLLPEPVEDLSRRVAVVIDVLRASSTLIALLEAGAEQIAITASNDEARVLAKARGALLCGESGGLRPLDFDYGNSPAECAALDLRAKQVVLSTSNGTRALLAASGAAAIYVGALPNATAVTSMAIARCRRDELGLTIICAGRDYGRLFSLEDAFCAGLLVERAWRIAGEHFVPDDGAVAAFRLFRSYEDQPAGAVFAESWNGQRLREWGLPADLDYCGAVDATTTVPVVRIDEGGLWVVADERR